jgi:sortase A
MVFYLGSLAVIGTGLILLSTLSSIPVPNSQKQAGLVENIETSTPEVVVGNPIFFSIPKIGVNASFEYVGVDQNGRMQDPEDADKVGWFRLGVKPGSKGNAVIAGHLDKASGAPAIFYNLSSLQAGDEVIVTDEKNNQFRYKVSEKVIYPFDEVPLEHIFGTTDKTRLNLITCDGVFNHNTKNYSHRMVIYSELVN